MKSFSLMLTITAIFTLLLMACTPKPLDIQLDDVAPKLVVASQVIPNQIMIVTLSKSFSALEFSQDDSDSIPDELLDQLLVTDGTVTISYLGQTDTLYMVVPGLYASITTPQYDNIDYTLEAYDPYTGLSVTSTTRMLPFVAFDTVYLSRETVGGFETIRVDYALNDPTGDNWYMINFYSGYNDPNDLSSPFQENNDGLAETELLSDQTFGSSYHTGHYHLFDVDEEEIDTLFITLSNISEEYYDYLALRERGGNLFSQVVSEPINYPSNVVGGYGFFNTHHPNIHIFDLDSLPE